ncbi:hypothetical protein Ahy_B08g089744 [Arachis hypogaea]|uniref:Transposase MuDR plant domain-containing protein n=1 Tax=Arachis hypogaea TaxID=3818 RepID=A0A444XYT2_ARAHY|nr:hypothetical protein Ahy_B08g089744 [Arachis hypogaea]
MNADVAEVANALANPHPFQEPSFMWSLDLEAMHAPEFSQYMNAAPPVVADGEFTVGMEFSSREAVIKAMKDYTIRRGVDYRVYESEPTIFYAKCTEYGNGCDWLIRGLPGIGARNGSRIQAQVTNSVSGPSISLQSTRVALHNDLYKCARHAEPQLNCMIPPKL